MKNKLALLQLPIILLFTLSFWITEMGVQGQLRNSFLRETLYPILSRASNIYSDLKFVLRGTAPAKNKIVTVEVDSGTIERIGRWPWHRDVMAFLIQKIFQSGAKVIGLDMVFSEPDGRVSEALADFLKEKKLGSFLEKFETDPQLRDVIQFYSDRLVVGWTSDTACQPFYEEPKYCPVTDPEATKLFHPQFDKFTVDRVNHPGKLDPAQTPLISFVTPIANIPPYTEAAKRSGYFNAILDSDGYIRRTNLVVVANGKVYPSLALEMARAGLGEKVQVNFNDQSRVTSVGFMNSNRTIPVSPLASMQINFRGPSRMFNHVSAEDVLSEKGIIEDPLNTDLLGQSVASILKDAYVLIGVTAVGVFDMRQFPFESNAAGVYGHAHILDNLLSGDPMIPGSSGYGSIAVLLLMIVGAIVFSMAIEKLDAVPALLVFLTTFLGLGLIDIKLVFGRNYSLNTVFLFLELGCIFAFTLAMKYVLEERNKKFIRGAFAKYVTPDMVDIILKDPTKLSLGGEKRELSIMFSDIRGFTTFSEKMDAKALTAFLNDYLGIMTKIVFANQGTLDKYIGDAVMAFWGAPLPQVDHAYNACKAALEMMAALKANQERFRSQYGIEVNIGIGINSGVVNVGNMGSEDNFEYTVIGDHVNLASRVEGLTKKYGASIVTTRFTFDCLQNTGKAPFPHRILDDVKVKGKQKAVELIQVLEQDSSAEGHKLFTEGRDLYRAQKWPQAIEKFSAAMKLLVSVPGTADHPCEVYLDRCLKFQAEPPAPDWDGSWEMDSK